MDLKTELFLFVLFFCKLCDFVSFSAILRKFLQKMPNWEPWANALKLSQN